MSDTAKNIINKSFERLVKTYAPQPVVLDRGAGVYAYDTDGKKYVDCAAGIAVASLGHAHPAMLKTINEQAAKLMAVQASYATEPKLECAELLTDHSCFDLVYFSNSGTESVEAALKLARKWAYDNKSEQANEIIAFKNSFHGRTMGSASMTYKRDKQPFFAPYISDVPFADFNDIESVKALVNDKTAAIIIEPVQGEGGLIPADEGFMKDLRALCDAENIALIFDEIQAGMGRLGTLFAYEQFGVEPDIACLAKGMGSGFPVGAMVAKRAFGDALVPGTHGTTYGGNPLATAVAATVIKELLKPELLENVKKVGGVLVDGLKDLQRSSNKITDVRGMGLMIGVDTTIDIKVLLSALQDHGMMATQAGDQTLRITPPLIMTEAEAKETLAIIEETLQNLD